MVIMLINANLGEVLCHNHNVNKTESELETSSSNTTTMPCYWSNYFRKRNRNRKRIALDQLDFEEHEITIQNHLNQHNLKNDKIIPREKCRSMMKNSSFNLSYSSFLFSLFLLLVIPSPQLQEQASSRNLINTLLFSSTEASESLIPRRGAFFASASTTPTGSSSSSSSVYKINPTALKSSRPNSILNYNGENSTSVQQTSNATTAAAAALDGEFLLNLVKSSFNQQQQNGTRLSMAKSPRPGQQREHMHYKTTYACEGNQLDLSCQEGKLIHLVRANYGRFSVSICNDFGNSNLSVQCYSFRAFLLMETKCNKLSNCSVIVSKDLFGDPCEGTSKYLEVQYYCDDANNNNQQQQIPSQPQMSNRNNNNGQQALDKEQQSVSATTAPNVHKSPQPQQQVVVTTQQVRAGEQQQQPARDDDQPTASIGSGGGGDLGTMSVIQQQQQQQFCLPQTSPRNLYWNYTRAGQLARQNCPDGSSGKASWFCDSERLRFLPSWSPDLTQCRSNWLQRLAHQLDQMLEQQQQAPAATNVKQPIDWQRQQSEQMLKVILNDLSLMASTKELFSEDLKRIDIMISQIIAQLKSLSVLYGSGGGGGATGTGSGAGSRWQRSAANSNNPLVPLYEELFNKLVAIVSSLFDLGQRSAWLDVQPAEMRRKLEQRYLNHLKDSGVMLANSLGPVGLEQQQLQQRQANVLAGITVINNVRLNSQATDQLDSNEFNLKLKQPPQAASLNRFVTSDQDETTAAAAPQLNEFRIHQSILRELANSNGITRFLVLDIKKPDYSLIRHQLESSYANNAAAAAVSQDSTYMDASSSNNINLPGDQQWSSRVFGVFAILGENGDILDGNSAESALTQQGNKLVDLLAQWPISVDFKVSPTTSTNNLNQLQQQPTRQCNSLSDNVNQPNRCQTLRFNSTNHLCRCDQFGFVALSSLTAQPVNDQQQQSQSQVPTIGQDLAWPPNAYNTIGRPQSEFDLSTPSNGVGFPPQRSLGETPPFMNSQLPAFVGAQDTAGKQQQPLSIWTIIFIVLGLSVFIVSLATFIINAVVRATSQCRLNKKPSHFLSTGTSILGSASSGPTTGPLAADHSLMGGEPLTAAAAAVAPPISGASTTTQSSGSIIGLTGASSNATTTCHAYKTHQQLYAAHYPALDGSCVARGTSQVANRWTAAWRRWLRPVPRWLGGVPTSSKGMDHLGGVQHCIVGHHPNLANQSHSSAAYKSHFQNGYTTGLHHHHHQQQQQHLQHHQHLQSPLVVASNGTGLQKAPSLSAAAPSSASSYVSSSAYYEEIGPGNLAKVNPSQLTNTHTIVDPFKRQQLPTATDQLTSHHHPHQIQQQQQQAWSYTQQQQQHHDGQQQLLASNYGPASVSGGSASQQNKHPLAQQQQQQMLHNDLSQLQQSSSSSAGSSASTSVTTANGSTPRHYLFASPSAVNAYKSSMGQQQQALNQQQHLHQLQQQHYLQQQQQQRFMPSG